jgi:hypothetical protein
MDYVFAAVCPLPRVPDADDFAVASKVRQHAEHFVELAAHAARDGSGVGRPAGEHAEHEQPAPRQSGGHVH